MNKKIVEENIENAYCLLAKSSIVTNNIIDNIYCGYISQFGVSVVQGSVKAAIAFYNGDEKKKVIVDLIYDLLQKNPKNLLKADAKNKGEILINSLQKTIDKEDIINASISIKLAMNLFEKKQGE